MVDKRRFLSSDYDYIAGYIDSELETRKGLEFRKDHETLWKEVDRQVRMKPMERISNDPEDDWRSAMELGDLSTASEILGADVLRLIFPQDRSWLQPHVDIEVDRLQARQIASQKPPIPKKELARLQKQADSELRAFMTQQHRDFGLRARVGLSVKEALHHGSFVAEVKWEEQQEYQMGGVFKSNAAPVWEPHSMWNAYPETLNLNANLIYTGSMILCWEKSYEWVLQQNYINLNTFKTNTSNKKDKVELKTWYGDITVKRKGKDVFLPNMKIIAANKTVVYAQPNDTTQVIFGGYERIDVRDPYYMSPLVKQSPNHKIASIIANRFLDNVELKLDPPIIYDGNDATLIKNGGPKMIPGYQTPAKVGTQNFKAIDIGDPSWAGEAIKFFKNEVQEGTGVSSSRAGAQRQADRITATQIEQESQGAEIRTIDFTGKIEKGLLAYVYISHELNKKKLSKYTFYNPEMGMKDFETVAKSDLPKMVHFDIVGSKGVITERRRSQMTSEVTAFLLGNERTAGLVDVEEVAKQMYQDAGNKTPEKLLTVQNDNDKVQKAIQEIQAKAEETIAQMQGEMQKTAGDLVSKEMELKNSQDQLKLRNERANGTETALREELRRLKDAMKQQTVFLEQLNKLESEKNEVEKLVNSNEPKDITETKEVSPVVVNIGKPAYKINRDDNGDMKTVEPIDGEVTAT